MDRGIAGIVGLRFRRCRPRQWFGPSLLVVTTGCCASPVMTEQRSRVLKSTATGEILAPGQSSKLTRQG